MNNLDYKDSLYYKFNHADGRSRNFIHRIVATAYKKRRGKSMPSVNKETWKEIDMPEWMNKLKGTNISPMEIGIDEANVFRWEYIAESGDLSSLWTEKELDKSMYKFLHSETFPEIDTESDRMLIEILKR